MAGNSHDIKALNGLVEGLVDSADGYQWTTITLRHGCSDNTGSSPKKS